MAIDNLENRCLNRKAKSALKYPLNSLLNLEDPKNFNLFQKRSKTIVPCVDHSCVGVYAKA